MTYNIGDPGHVKAHSDLVSAVNVELARFGLTGALPIKDEGAEGHLDDHNAIRAKLEQLATTAGRSFSTPLPPVRQLGDGSHTDDHNTLAACASEVATWPAWNAATGGLEQSHGNYNNTGERWMVHTFTGNGTLTVTRNVQKFRLLVIGGGGSGGTGEPNGSGGGGGGGGGYLSDAITLTNGPHTITIGGGAHSNADYYPSGPSGGDTSFDSIKCGGGGGGGTGAHTGGKPHGGGAGGRAGSGGGGGGGSGGTGATDRGRAGAGTGSNVTTNISGASKTYGVGGSGNDGWSNGTMSAEPGAGGASHQPVNGCVSYAGRNGVVIVAYRVG